MNGIILKELSFSDFKFDDEYESAIQRKQVAEQNVIKEGHELESFKIKKKREEVEALAIAKAEIIRAENDAEIIIINAKAQLEAIEIKMKGAIKYHEGLSKAVSKETLKLKAIDAWNGELPKVSSGKNIGIIFGKDDI